MGPYVCQIVNSFKPEDDIYYFFLDYEDEYFYKNVKKTLLPKCFFYNSKNSKTNKIYDLLPIRPRYFNKVVRLCKSLNIELVHFINNPGDKSLISVLEKNGIVCISTVHDLIPHEVKKEWYKELRLKVLYYKLHCNLLESKYLITNSIYQYKELKATFKEKSVFYHSFPSLVTSSIINGKKTPSELHSLDKPYILFFGRIEDYKGVELLYNSFVNTIELYKNYYLVIAGSGTLPKSVKYHNSVILINRYIYDDEVSHLYQNAKIVVYPYKTATQSGVLSLAFYYKKPVLTSNVPFFKSIIENIDHNLLFEANNSKDLVQKLICLLNSDLACISNKVHKYYDSSYDSCAIRTELMSIYTSL